MKNHYFVYSNGILIFNE
ncbi:MAG TPA: hypothetical protein DDE71_08920 [Tenacibaculum sp.]|nr:hypothetical protein [Tenacibaculum sp.]